MIATTKLAFLMAAVLTVVIGIAATSSTPAEAQVAISEKGVKFSEGQVTQEAGHWGTVNYVDQQACTNEIAQAKVPRDDRPLTEADPPVGSIEDNQVQEVGTQSVECGDVTQSAEINNSVVDESVTNDESTRNTNIEMGDPIPDLD